MESEDVKKENPQIEYTKIQGFDVFEKLPEEGKLKSYNSEFFNSLSNLKFLSLTVPAEDKLFYHFEQNQNASLTSTIGQMETTVKELSSINLEVKDYLEIIQSHVDILRKRVEVKDDEGLDDLLPEIEKLEKSLKKFLVEQKTENFKLIKEIAILQKDKDDLYNQIQICFSRLAKVEKDVGKKCKNLKKNNDKSFHMNQTQMNSTVSEKEYNNTKVQ